jgi:hypothetical protein
MAYLLVDLSGPDGPVYSGDFILTAKVLTV